MHIICLTPLEEGVYNDHSSDSIIAPPDGWAMIPEGLLKPPTFPRLGSIEAAEIDGVMTVTEWTAGEIPEQPEVAEEPTEMEQLRADVDYIAIMTGVAL